LTYAQKLCCGGAQRRSSVNRGQQTDGVCKSLIFNKFLFCTFCGQSSGSVEFQGLGALHAGLSTKLSTQMAPLL
jgi:hypothetical protein